MTLRCADDPRYTGCAFVTPEDSRHHQNSLISHRRRVHEGWESRWSGHAANKLRENFLAIYEVVGTIDTALFHAPKHHLVVEPAVAALWVEAYEDKDQPIDQKKVARWERKLRQAEEWDARKTNALNRQALQKADQAFIKGEITLAEMGTAHRYVGDNWHWGEKAVKEAYGEKIQQPAQLNQFFQIDTGQPRRPRQLKQPDKTKVIDVTAREITSGHSDP